MARGEGRHDCSRICRWLSDSQKFSHLDRFQGLCGWGLGTRTFQPQVPLVLSAQHLHVLPQVRSVAFLPFCDTGTRHIHLDASAEAGGSLGMDGPAYRLPFYVGDCFTSGGDRQVPGTLLMVIALGLALMAPFSCKA